jgi:hypothetical protein
MPVRIRGASYCRTGDVCRRANASIHTAFEWWQESISCSPRHWGSWGWRLFTTAQVQATKAKNGRVFVASQSG